jgi:surface protein
LDVSGWDVAKVTHLTATFANNWAQSTLDVSGWITTSLTICWETFFQCHALTVLDVSGWDVSGVTTFGYMFTGDSLLTTINVSSWDTGLGETYNQMFYDCTALTGLDLSGWDITSATDMTNLLINANNALSQANYDALLIAWAAQSTPQSSVTVHFGDATYSTGDPTTARGVLTSTYNWTITDGGQN